MTPITVEMCRVDKGRIVRVVRDDYVPGGTKQRVLERILKPDVEYVYPSPAYGYAQIALALAAAHKGSQATIFIAKRNVLHERTQRAQDAGAKIIEVPYGMQSVVTARARTYALRRRNASLLPLGFDMPEFDTGLDAVLSDVHMRPRQVFCVVGTGTLYRGLKRRWPYAEFHVVQTGMKPRIDLGRARVHVPPESYHQDAKLPPPYPSCSNSDAKVWRYVLECARGGALVWNVAA